MQTGSGGCSSGYSAGVCRRKQGPPWHNGQQFCSTTPGSQAKAHLRHVSSSGTILLSFFLWMPFFPITLKILWVQLKSCLAMKSSAVWLTPPPTPSTPYLFSAASSLLQSHV